MLPRDTSEATLLAVSAVAALGAMAGAIIVAFDLTFLVIDLPRRKAPAAPMPLRFKVSLVYLFLYYRMVHNHPLISSTGIEQVIHWA